MKIGVFGGPWDTGHSARDGAVLGFEDVHRDLSLAARHGHFELVPGDIGMFRCRERMREFLTACDVVYANCGPWAALLHLLRERESLEVAIVREVRTVGWIGYLWQEQVAAPVSRPLDQRVFPSRYARDIWDAALPCRAVSRIYYPMITRPPEANQACGGRASTIGFFSALSRDKGFHNLPALVSRLRDAGHPVRNLLLAGDKVDAALYGDVVTRLARLEVEVDYRGGVANTTARELMAQCDCVLFLSCSSIESLGRVMVEAWEQGVPVISADFGAARHLLQADYRIPVEWTGDAAGASDIAFPVAQINPAMWQAPGEFCPGECFSIDLLRYKTSGKKMPSVFRVAEVESAGNTLPRRFSFSSDSDAIALAESLLDTPHLLDSAEDFELTDLGGTLKQFLLSRGYRPQVTFQHEDSEPAQAESTEGLPMRAAL